MILVHDHTKSAAPDIYLEFQFMCHCNIFNGFEKYRQEMQRERKDSNTHPRLIGRSPPTRTISYTSRIHYESNFQRCLNLKDIVGPRLD